ncbi:unnamed protein product [Symbiodinium natans]|uniref:Uncharacterized protein n=1 Tax=Symbiodinium natans TaxID=878477 RepID=A0A812THC7_9DINO|nr:unnamed protein product [Symbiodinium natans]
MDENGAAEETELSHLLDQYIRPQAVELRCESCGGTRRGESQVSIEKVGRSLVVGQVGSTKRTCSIDIVAVQCARRMWRWVRRGSNSRQWWNMCQGARTRDQVTM